MSQTRKQTDIWLIGQPLTELNCTKLPNKREVLRLFMHFTNEKSVAESYTKTAEAVIELYKKARIPTKLKKHVIEKVKNLHSQWKLLKKTKKTRQNGLRQLNTKKKIGATL